MFLLLAFLFFVGCTGGWVLELFYRRFKKENTSRRWVNPGFLTGPYLPLYGFGLCIMYALSELSSRLPLPDHSLPVRILTVLLMGGAMTLTEYIAGLIFIKGMKIKLWDYSTRPGNRDGIICPLFSAIWTVLSGIYLFVFHKKVCSMVSWFEDNLAFSFVVGFFFGIFLIDVCYTLKLVTKIRTAAKENGILVRYEELKDEIRARAEAERRKYAFLFALSDAGLLREHIRLYAEKRRRILDEEKEELAEKWKKVMKKK